MLILALDTATEQVGAAVVDGDRGPVLGRASFRGRASHGEQLAPLVEQALAQADVSVGQLAAIGVGRGPGPFTGLRVGLVHAEVMAWALDVPIHGVCTLDVMARQVHEQGHVGPFLVATDARRREVYWARYDASGVRVAGPNVGAAAQIDQRQLPAFGAGAASYGADLFDHGEPRYPDPAVLARMAGELLIAGEPAEVAPLYLRRPDAVAAVGRKRVTPS